MDTGVVVERHKGEGLNRYILTLPGQKPETFDDFRIDVPEAIQQALKIYEVQIDAKEFLNLNVALQHDNLFLLSSVPSLRARILGKLSGATILDAAIRELNKDKRQTTAEKGSKELEVVDLNSQIDKLAPIEAFSSQISDIEAGLTSLALAEQRVARIAELFRRVTLLKGAWQRETAIEALLGQVEVGKIVQLEQKFAKLSSLSLLLSKFTEFQAVCEHQIKLHALLAQIDLDSIGQLEPKVNRVKKLVMLNDKYNAWQGMYSKQSLINNLLTPVDISVIPVLAEKASNLKRVKDLSVRIGKNQKELISKTDELGRVEQQYQEAKEQYSEMLRLNKVCPVCNQETVNL
jgi:hypothetical protein